MLFFTFRPMLKHNLRTLFKEKRALLSQEQVVQYSIDIANKALTLDIWGHKNYHIFLPIASQNEVDTTYLLHVLQGKDKNVVVSTSDFKTYVMSHYLLTDNTLLKVNQYGIPEPVDGIPFPIAQIDVVFVPLLAYDTLGNRVGYGKGFYDRFMAQCNPNCLFVGLSFFNPVNKIQDLQKSDITLSHVITPVEVYTFLE